MNIQERKNKDGKITSYRIRVFDHRDAQTGKQVFRTLSVKYDNTKSAAWNKKNAEKQAVIFEKGIEEQTASDSRITFNEYCDYAIKIKEQSSISASTAYSYRCSQKRIAPYLGHVQLKKMTPAMINAAYSKMLENGLSRNSTYAMHLFVHTILAMAFKEGLIPRNYADAATPPKKRQPVVDALSEEQLDNFFRLLYKETSGQGYMYQVFFSLLLATGCRIGELCALSWDNIDFEENRIHICKHFITDSTGIRIEEGCKTNAGDRWLYMDDETMDMLKEYRNYYNQTAKTYGTKWNYFSKAVFFSRQNPGCYLYPETTRKWLRSFTDRNHLPRIHPHQFRHTAISLQLQNGISIPEAAKRAGHSRPDVTLRTYSHTLKDNDRHCCEVVTQAIPKMPKRNTG
jgi:integrase